MRATLIAAALHLTAAKPSAERQLQVERSNLLAQGVWTADAQGRFGELPVGAVADLCGVNTFGGAHLRASDPDDPLFVHAPIVSDATAASVPDSFDSEASWPSCAKVIGDIRDQSHCGCCWAFGAASAASDRACIATNGTIALPFSAQDTCFNAGGGDGCSGGGIDGPWEWFAKTGVVTGTQQLVDAAPTPSDPFYGAALCSAFALPHCHHHGPTGADVYPAEGAPGCPQGVTPAGPTACDAGAKAPHADYAVDKYSFVGKVEAYPNDVATVQAAIMAGGPVETAFTVYADFEDYAGGVYFHTNETVIGGHAVRIVGWGQETLTNGTVVPYWKVANSWNP